MRRKKEPLPVFAITNPNKAWVSSEIDRLIEKWEDWTVFCQSLADGPDSQDYDPSTCAEAIKDGYANREKHEILREATLVFLRNHFSGAEFILSKWPTHPHEDTTGRLNRNAASWVHRLKILKASMEYVQVPDGFWQGQAKQFLEKLSASTADGAIDVAKSYLMNPLMD